MTKKITISIPDMLHEKLEKWRRSFNLSKMFQEAVTDAIQKKEDFQKRIQEDLDMADILERLRMEKMKSEGNYAENGKLEGLTWAKTAHYDDLRYALDWTPGEKPFRDDVLGEYLSRKLATDKLMDASGETVNEYARAYITGWKRGVEEFWDEIGSKL